MSKLSARQVTEAFPINRPLSKMVDMDKLFSEMLKLLPKAPYRRKVPIPENASAKERWMRELLGVAIRPNGDLSCLGHYMAWSPGDKTITLDSEFTADELEAIAWWMRRKR